MEERKTIYSCLAHMSEAGVNLPKAIIEWVKGNKVDASILQPEYGRMFSKNDYLMEIN